MSSSHRLSKTHLWMAVDVDWAPETASRKPFRKMGIKRNRKDKRSSILWHPTHLLDGKNTNFGFICVCVSFCLLFWELLHSLLSSVIFKFVCCTLTFVISSSVFSVHGGVPLEEMSKNFFFFSSFQQNTRRIRFWAISLKCQLKAVNPGVQWTRLARQKKRPRVSERAKARTQPNIYFKVWPQQEKEVH